jgi:hypothetical protein
MTEHTTDGEGDRAANAADAADAADRPLLVAELVLSRHRPAECTIYPFDADDLERTTTWVTAGEGSFVSTEGIE